MGKYGVAAVLAVNLINSGKMTCPVEAWKSAANEIFGNITSGQKKGCPRNAFLGLCEKGLVKGIPSGLYNKRSLKNKKYAIEAYELLLRQPDFASSQLLLWGKVADTGKKHSSQMDVVISLWNNGLLL